ncbi:MAG: MBL fold metallo-hydrolase [Candidatus Cloacimonetes bacterium]|nr:MBL fold metallo-hydrolase [Candidatus Cloacimonadota bacterium]
MQIGQWTLHAVDTGRFRLDGGAMFGVIPKTLWNKTNPADEKNRIEMALRTLLLDNGKQKIIVDTGIGTKFSEKEALIYGIDHARFQIDIELHKIGLSRLDITDVFLTHLHFDHAGGTTYREGGELKLTFPNAKYHIDRFHYEWAMQPTKRDKASFLGENFQFLEEKGVLHFFDGKDCSLWPQTKVIKVHGHTPHQSLLQVFDGSETLLYCADLIPMSSHIPLPWIMGYDLNALQTLGEKEIILEQAVRENWILFFEHDPFFEAARVENTEKGDFRARTLFNLDSSQP